VTEFADELNIIDPYYLDEEELEEVQAILSLSTLPCLLYTFERNENDTARA